MARKSPLKDIKFLDALVEEIKKVNYRQINSLCQKDFTIGLVGSDKDIAAMKDWLFLFPYMLAFGNHPTVQGVFNAAPDRMDNWLTIIPLESPKDLDDKIIKSNDFCLVSPALINDVKRVNVAAYAFDASDVDVLPKQILTNHPEISFALAHRFPIFRVSHANREITDTAFQNLAWAIGTAAPNVIPGPQQLVTGPIEAVSDFAILTTNEVKMLFVLTGSCGYHVNPLKLLVEFGILYSTAKLAQTAATNVAGKFSAIGIAAKGGLAFAFTHAIGDALFFYLTTGQKVGREFFEDKIKAYFDQGKIKATELLKDKLGTQSKAGPSAK
ncbi:MAG: hypothetical protein HPY50_00430 [Firmicutes bacterium]|nr:hypothetical protein [Bacillota bacterium]